MSARRHSPRKMGLRRWSVRCSPDGASDGGGVMATTAVPAVEGWFTTGDEPRLVGTRCTSCATVFFPAATGFCRNPACRGRELVAAELSRTGTVWSYTDAQYQPPPPYIPRGEDGAPYEPFAI